VKGRRSGLNVRDGAIPGSDVPAGLATGPAWPSCAAAAAPSAWIASVRRRNPGIASSRSKDLAPVGAALRRDGTVRDRVQSDAAAGHAAVELDQLVGHQALRRPALEGRRLDDPIAQRDRSERRWRERLGRARDGRERHRRAP
jgi:hypothetical protein